MHAARRQSASILPEKLFEAGKGDPPPKSCEATSRSRARARARSTEDPRASTWTTGMAGRFSSVSVALPLAAVAARIMQLALPEAAGPLTRSKRPGEASSCLTAASIFVCGPSISTLLEADEAAEESSSPDAATYLKAKGAEIKAPAPAATRGATYSLRLIIFRGWMLARQHDLCKAACCCSRGHYHHAACCCSRGHYHHHHHLLRSLGGQRRKVRFLMKPI